MNKIVGLILAIAILVLTCLIPVVFIFEQDIEKTISMCICLMMFIIILNILYEINGRRK